jgi:NAD(P)H dehydrogenase (quinone)
MKVLVVFYSMTGNTARLARAVADGAKSRGAEVRIRQVAELIPQSKIDKMAHVKIAKEEIRDIEYATNDDLRWADGVCFGSPTRFGNMSSQLKNFIDQTSELWLSGELVGKVAACFTSTSTQHGGQETTLLSMMIPLLHLGFVIQGLPYAEKEQMGIDGVHGGSPYGVSSISGPKADRLPTDVDLVLAQALGKRIAVTAHKLRANEEKSVNNR